MYKRQAIPHFLYIIQHTANVTNYSYPPPSSSSSEKIYISENSERYIRYRAFANMARAYLSLGETQKAIASAVSALRVEPYAYGTILFLRKILMQNGINPQKVDEELSRLVWSSNIQFSPE